MEAFPPKFSSVLVTPDPQYIPGYGGYCPQLKFTMGGTYGQLTSRILSDPEVSRSRQLILYNSSAPSGKKEGEDKLTEDAWGSLPGMRRHPGTMIPGYTGFIPKSRNCFSNTYSRTCRDALGEFHRDLQKTRRLSASASLPPLGPNAAPLVPVTKDLPPYQSPTPWQPLGSPYSMKEDNPNKCFISGFTGFVPRSRFLFGSGFPFITNKALVQFQKEAGAKDGVLKPAVRELPPAMPIYPSQSGMMPSYTGHVPGYRFTFGQTFGHLTQNALGLSGVQRER
ncbi:hypothetical protein GJAV_G00047730 [Gymnothorax javanicus]|nr:hypothetical protein GJAV_G00047730 [Gymnothorax javanicus]